MNPTTLASPTTSTTPSSPTGANAEPQEKGPQLITEAKPKPKQENTGPQLVLSDPKTSDSKNTNTTISNEGAAIDEPIQNANSIAEMDLPQLLNKAQEFEKQLSNDATSFQKQADLAKATNQKYADLAANEKAQLTQLQEGPNAEDPEIVEEISNLTQDATEHEFTANAANDLSAIYQVKAEERRGQAKVAKDQKETIASAIKNEQTSSDLEYLDEIKSSLEEVEIGYEESTENPGNQVVYNDLLTKYKQQENQIEKQNTYINDLSGALISDKTKLRLQKGHLYMYFEP